MWLMPIILRKLYAKYDYMTSILLKTKELLRYLCGCHGNIVTITTEYVADAYYPKDGFVSKMNLITLKTKELLRYHCGCHGNIITIVIEYVADALCQR